MDGTSWESPKLLLKHGSEPQAMTGRRTGELGAVGEREVTGFSGLKKPPHKPQLGQRKSRSSKDDQACPNPAHLIREVIYNHDGKVRRQTGHNKLRTEEVAQWLRALTGSSMRT